jgi:hypothetical protein
MSTVILKQELVPPNALVPRDVDFELEHEFKIASPQGVEVVNSPDEVCELICDAVAEQFWDWFHNRSRIRRFKPHVKVYEVG